MAAPAQMQRPGGDIKRRITMVGNTALNTVETMESMYQPLEVIGNGTFGIIRKVKRVKDGIILARKELNYARMDQKDLLQLSSEVNILQNLKANPHIVKYYDRFVDKKNCMLFILMEFCEGGDLANLINRCKRERTLIPEDMVWSYLTQLTLALHDCHSTTDPNGTPKEVILHRDIKPENVFLDKDNNLKLGDFGLSKAMSVAAFTNTYVGTPYYMSPELISGSDYGRSSDIWALGCLIYELCAWRPPFHEAKTQIELAKLIKEGKIPDLPKSYSSTLSGVIRSMLRQNPKQRPTTEQLKSLDLVKMQLRISELHKNVLDIRIQTDNLKRQEQELVNRAAQLNERERELAAREAALIAREAAIAERERNSLNSSAPSSDVICSRCMRSSTSSVGSVISSTMERRRSIYEGDHGVLARVASRPSLVPVPQGGNGRKVLEERRNTVSKRGSEVALSSMVQGMDIDGTPMKSVVMEYEKDFVTPSAATKRRSSVLPTSKSIPNISGYLSTADMTSTPMSVVKEVEPKERENANPFLRSPSKASMQLPLSPRPSSRSMKSGTVDGEKKKRRPVSVVGLSTMQAPTRTQSENVITKTSRPGSPQRQGSVVSGATATVSAPSAPNFKANGLPLPPSLNPNTPPSWDLENDNDIPSPFIKKGGVTSRSHHRSQTTSALSVLKDMQAMDSEDEENLPSPFIKPKLSAAVTRAKKASAGLGPSALSNVIAKGTPTLSSGTAKTRLISARTTGSRFSVGSRLLAARGKVDEEGRKISNVGTSTVTSRARKPSVSSSNSAL